MHSYNTKVTSSVRVVATRSESPFIAKSSSLERGLTTSSYQANKAETIAITATKIVETLHEFRDLCCPEAERTAIWEDPILT